MSNFQNPTVPPTGVSNLYSVQQVEHCFMYVVQDDVVDTVIGPPDYVEQVLNERRRNMHEAWSPLPGSEDKH